MPYANPLVNQTADMKLKANRRLMRGVHHAWFVRGSFLTLKLENKMQNEARPGLLHLLLFNPARPLEPWLMKKLGRTWRNLIGTYAEKVRSDPSSDPCGQYVVSASC